MLNFRALSDRRVASAIAPGLVALFVASASVGCGPGGGNAADYLVTFALSGSPADLSGLEFDVDYTAKGDFVGTGTHVSCKFIADLADVTSTFTDDDQELLHVALSVADTGDMIPGDEATELVQCTFSASTQPTTAGFHVTVTSATDDSGDPVAVGNVDVIVSAIDLASSATLVANGAE